MSARYVWRELLRNPRRTLASLAGVVLGVGLFSGVLFFVDGSGASMTQRGGLDAFEHFSRPAVIMVGVPVMILAGVATYFNSRASVARQSPEAAANPQTARRRFGHHRNKISVAEAYVYSAHKEQITLRHLVAAIRTAVFIGFNRRFGAS